MSKEKPPAGAQISSKQLEIEMTTQGEETVTNVKIITEINSEKKVTTKTFRGSKAEVEQQIRELR